MTHKSHKSSVVIVLVIVFYFGKQDSPFQPGCSRFSSLRTSISHQLGMFPRKPTTNFCTMIYSFFFCNHRYLLEFVVLPLGYRSPCRGGTAGQSAGGSDFMITISASMGFTADIYVPQRKDSPHLVDLLAICLPNCDSFQRQRVLLRSSCLLQVQL